MVTRARGVGVGVNPSDTKLRTLQVPAACTRFVSLCLCTAQFKLSGLCDMMDVSLRFDGLLGMRAGQIRCTRVRLTTTATSDSTMGAIR